MIERRFKTLDTMIGAIREACVGAHFVVPNFNYFERKYGWFCPGTDEFFFLSYFDYENAARGHFVMKSAMDNQDVRNELSIYLSNCTTKSEYAARIARAAKLKAFW